MFSPSSPAVTTSNFAVSTAGAVSTAEAATTAAPAARATSFVDALSAAAGSDDEATEETPEDTSLSAEPAGRAPLFLGLPLHLGIAEGRGFIEAKPGERRSEGKEREPHDATNTKDGTRITPLLDPGTIVPREATPAFVPAPSLAAIDVLTIEVPPAELERGAGIDDARNNGASSGEPLAGVTNEHELPPGLNRAGLQTKVESEELKRTGDADVEPRRTVRITDRRPRVGPADGEARSAVSPTSSAPARPSSGPAAPSSGLEHPSGNPVRPSGTPARQLSALAHHPPMDAVRRSSEPSGSSSEPARPSSELGRPSSEPGRPSIESGRDASPQLDAAPLAQQQRAPQTLGRAQNGRSPTDAPAVSSQAGPAFEQIRPNVSESAARVDSRAPVRESVPLGELPTGSSGSEPNRKDAQTESQRGAKTDIAAAASTSGSASALTSAFASASSSTPGSSASREALSSPLVPVGTTATPAASPKMRDAVTVFVPPSLTAARVMTTVAVNHTAPARPVSSLSTEAAATLPQSVAHQIVEAIQLNWSGGRGTARIQLEPTQYGDLTVSLRVDQGQVTARLEASSPIVREWLQHNQTWLRDGLAEQNLTLDRLEVAEPAPSRDAERRDNQQPPSREGRQSRRPHRPETGELFEIVA